MKVLFTGDLHFGHENVIQFDGRPFETVEEMDAEIIRRWNNKVDKGDLVYVLGDMIWKARNDDAPGIIKSLNGQIILIKGNHDRFLHNEKGNVTHTEKYNLENVRPSKWQIESMARCFLPHIREYFESKEGQRAFERWQKENM